MTYGAVGRSSFLLRIGSDIVNIIIVRLVFLGRDKFREMEKLEAAG